MDLEGISNNDFDSIEISLLVKGKKRTVKAKKIDNQSNPFTILEYQISQRKYIVRANP